MEVVASLSQGRTAAAQCGLFTHKSVPVIFEPPCITAEVKSTCSFKMKSHMFIGFFEVTVTAILLFSSTCCASVLI